MVFSLAQHGQAFSTRPRGVEVLHALESAAADADQVVVDFAEVRHISYSFADEFVGALLERTHDGRWQVAVELRNVPAKFQRLIDSSAETRGVPQASLTS